MPQTSIKNLLVYEKNRYDRFTTMAYDFFLYRHQDGTFSKELRFKNGIEVIIEISIFSAKRDYEKYKYKIVSYEEAFAVESQDNE